MDYSDYHTDQECKEVTQNMQFWVFWDFSV